MLNFKKLMVLAVSALFVVVSVDAASADAVRERKAAFKANGKAMKAMKTALESGTTDGVAKNARTISAFAANMEAHFPKGSGGGETRAKPEIWSDWDGFKKAISANYNAAIELAKIADSGDVAKTFAGLKALGKTCGGCHKPYRVPKE